MLRHLALLTAFLGLVLGDIGVLGVLAADVGRGCVCEETSADTCCVVEEPSCCTGDGELADRGGLEDVPHVAPPCGCGAHDPLPTLVGGGPSVPVIDEAPELDDAEGSLPRPLADQTLGQPQAAPEPPPPRA